jgi:hypothetical protein
MVVRAAGAASRMSDPTSGRSPPTPQERGVELRLHPGPCPVTWFPVAARFCVLAVCGQLLDRVEELIDPYRFGRPATHSTGDRRKAVVQRPQLVAAGGRLLCAVECRLQDEFTAVMSEKMTTRVRAHPSSSD